MAFFEVGNDHSAECHVAWNIIVPILYSLKQTITYLAWVAFLGMNLTKVSPLKPRRKVSNGIISLGAILPRFTLAPSSCINHACCAFIGASHIIFSPGTLLSIL